MKKMAYLLVLVSLAGVVAGCAQKTDAQKLQDDMNKMGKDMQKNANKTFGT